MPSGPPVVLSDQVRTALIASVATLSQDGVVATAEDILRLFAEQATLELQTQVVKTALASDPFERWDSDDESTSTTSKRTRRNVQTLSQRVRVVDYHRVHTKEGYVNLQATVQLPPATTFSIPATKGNDTTNNSNDNQTQRKRPRKGSTAVDVPDSTGARHEPQQVQRHVQLQFRYERTRSTTNTTTHSDASKDAKAGADLGASTVWYSIDLSKDYGPAERLLWVQVWGDGPVPAPGRAHNMEAVDEFNDDDDELWSDMKSDDENGEMGKPADADGAQLSQDETGAEKDNNDNNNTVQTEKSHDGNEKVDSQNGLCTVASAISTNDTQRPQAVGSSCNKEEQPCDRFVAGIDPDLLERFLDWTGLGPMDDLTAFFVLMTFPFYEHEWDLVGLLLDAVFDMDADDADAQDAADEDEDVEEEELNEDEEMEESTAA